MRRRNVASPLADLVAGAVPQASIPLAGVLRQAGVRIAGGWRWRLLSGRCCSVWGGDPRHPWHRVDAEKYSGRKSTNTYADGRLRRHHQPDQVDDFDGRWGDQHLAIACPGDFPPPPGLNCGIKPGRILLSGCDPPFPSRWRCGLRRFIPLARKELRRAWQSLNTVCGGLRLHRPQCSQIPQAAMSKAMAPLALTQES